MRGDGRGAAEQRLTLFQRPHHVPVGEARRLLNNEQFLDVSEPLSRQSEQHAHAVRGLCKNEVSPQIRGLEMRDVVEMRSNQVLAAHADCIRSEHICHMQMSTGTPSTGNEAGQAPARFPPGRSYVPSKAILGAGPDAGWDVSYSGAAHEASVTARDEYITQRQTCDNLKIRGHSSQLAFGDHELNPGFGHADDYGVARNRPNVRPLEAHKATLITDDAKAPPTVKGPHAGRRSQTTFDISEQINATRQKCGPFAGRRQASVLTTALHFAQPQLMPPVPCGL